MRRTTRLVEPTELAQLRSTPLIRAVRTCIELLLDKARTDHGGDS